MIFFLIRTEGEMVQWQKRRRATASGCLSIRRVSAKGAAEQANARNAVAGPAPASGVVPLQNREGERASAPQGVRPILQGVPFN